MERLGVTFSSSTKGFDTDKLKDTIFRKDRQQQFWDDDSESSSCKELSRSEENALRRSFQAIQPDQSEGATGTSDDMADPYNWRPSPGIQEQITGISTPTKTRNWDSEIETVQLEGDSIQLIQPTTRESTPDSTGFSNQLTMPTEPGSRPSQLNAGNVQAQLDTLRAHGQGTNPFGAPITEPRPQPAIGKSMREVVKDKEDAPDEKIHVSHLQVQRERTSQEPPPVNTYATKKETFDVEASEKEEKNVYPCYPRCLLFAVGIAILLGGVVAAVVIFKKNSAEAQHGQIIPNVIIEDECETAFLSLGEQIVFQCTFDVTHEYRKQIPLTRNVTVTSPDQLPPSDFKFESGGAARDFWLIHGPWAKCTSEGTYTIRFLDGDGMELYKASVMLRIKPSTVKGSIMQRRIDDYGGTVFDVSCSINNDCNNYDVDFVGKRVSYSPVVYLNANKKCTSTYSVDTGYNITCMNVLSEDDVDTYKNYLGCWMTSSPTRISTEYRLPSCLLTQECNFNCTNRLYGNPIENLQREALDAGECDNNRIMRCFPPGRPVWKHRVCPVRPEDCSGYVEQYECRLGWCRSGTGVLYKNELAGEVLCGRDYPEKVPETTTTTTPTPPPTTQQIENSTNP